MKNLKLSLYLTVAMLKLIKALLIGEALYLWDTFLGLVLRVLVLSKKKEDMLVGKPISVVITCSLHIITKIRYFKFRRSDCWQSARGRVTKRAKF